MKEEEVGRVEKAGKKEKEIIYSKGGRNESSLKDGNRGRKWKCKDDGNGRSWKRDGLEQQVRMKRR